MKLGEKQTLKSSSLMAIVGLAFLAMSIVSAPWNRIFVDNQSQSARQKAEVVGYQVVQIYREALLKSNAESGPMGRGPASIDGPQERLLAGVRTVGSMGLDPWGEPFHYRVLPIDDAGKMRILVWSLGPNKKNETPRLDEEEAKIGDIPVYGGDDLGVVLSMPQNATL